MRFVVAVLVSWTACTGPPELTLRPPALYSLPAAGAFPGVPGLANQDDDNGNSIPDWDDLGDGTFDPMDDDDLVPIVLPATIWEGLKRGESLRLRLDGHVDRIRIWHGDTLWLGGEGPSQVALSPPAGGGTDLTLDVEWKQNRASAIVLLERLDEDGKVKDESHLTLTASPLVMNHHLQPAERIFTVHVDDAWGDNNDFVAVYEYVLGDRLTVADGETYWGDVWIQDEFEFATLRTGDQRRDVVIDSVRDRGLDEFAEDELLANQFAIEVWGDPELANSLDSLGNMEITPPIVVDGIAYPFGRAYWGGAEDYHPAEEMREMVEAERIQAPVITDTSWLSVGHVDEFASWLPDSTAPKGFRFLLSNVDLAWEILEGVDPQMPLPRYEDHGYDTVGEIAGDAALRAHNEDIQRDVVDVIDAQLRREFGLQDDDILYVPGLWEAQPGAWGGGSAALIPGMVNLVVVQGVTAEAPIEVFLADPFFRTDLGDREGDPIVQWWLENVPDQISLNFLDDWYVYHLGLGEVHCGSNTTRTPTADWWTTAGELL